MRTSGARAIVATLERLGVTRAFGIPGIQTLELFDALADAAFDTVVATDERAAAFMADAHARVTGTLGVAVVVPGPGLTNALTGLAEAFCDSSPVLAVVPGPDATVARAFRLHDVDQAALLRPVTKAVFEVTGLATVTHAVLAAAAAAVAGEPGPVAVIVPQDLFLAVGTVGSPVVSRPVPVVPDPAALDGMAAELLASPSAVIYAGRGAAGAAGPLLELAERLRAPIATTISGRGVVAEDHPLGVGFGFGPSGSAAAWRALRHARTLLSVGCKFSEPATGTFGGRPPRRHLHVDVNPDSIGRNYHTDVALVADASLAVEGLLERIATTPRRPALAPRARPADRSPAADAVTPTHLFRALRACLDRDAIVTVDSGSHQFWALEAFPVYAPGTFLAPADFQSMGFSIPSAIAAKLACPGRQVVAVVGDGGFLIAAAELATAQRLGVPLVVLVFRDGALGLIREAQRQVHRRTPFTAVPDADLGGLARAFGMDHARIAHDAEAGPALAAALSSGRGVVVEAAVRYDVPSRYFRGAGRAAFAHLPWDRRARLAFRRAWRELCRSS